MKKYLFLILTLLLVGCVSVPVKFYKVSRNENGSISETHITRGFPFVEKQQVIFKDYNTGKWESFKQGFEIEIIP